MRVYIYTNVLHRTAMECSRDSCRHMRYIDCSSAIILGTSRLLSAPDPLGLDVGSKEAPPKLFKLPNARDVSRGILWPNRRPVLCCVFVPWSHSKRQPTLESAPLLRLTFLPFRSIGRLSCFLVKERVKGPISRGILEVVGTVSGGAVLITYFQVHSNRHSERDKQKDSKKKWMNDS